MNRRFGARRTGIIALRSVLFAAIVLAVAATSQAAPRGGFGGGGGHFGGAPRAFAGGGRHFGGGFRGGPVYGGGRYFGGARFRGGGRFYGGRGYYYGRPRSFFSLGIGIGYPYYYPPVYEYYPEPYPVYVPAPAVTERIEITNEAPPGYYYYDPYCDRRFSTLDRYLDHLQDYDHDPIIEVIDKDTGTRARTYEYVKGDWTVRD